MPTPITDSSEMRELIHFTPSAPYELLLSLGTVDRIPARHRLWAERARAALGPDLLADAHYFYTELWTPLVLMELPVDYPGPGDDSRGFIDYVAGMDADAFLFYLLGRIIPREDLGVLRADPKQVPARIYEFYEANWPGSGDEKLLDESMVRVVAAPAATQARLVALLRAFDERVFQAEIPGLRLAWAASIEDQQRTLAGMDPPVFLNQLLKGGSIPRMYPEGTPLREIRVIPSYYSWRSNFHIWGYGTVVVLYNATRTEQREQERDQDAERLTQIAAALADPNRLKILAVIAQDPEAYGHKLARHCGISQPAVSRHMGILKRAGLVEEVPRDGRMSYRLCRAALEEFLPQLLRYIEE
jgi:DNA-binding transcriptional ArsR family regulator